MAVFTGNGSAASPSFTFSSDPDTGIYRDAANTLRFSTGGLPSITIGTDQFVGIGNTSPTVRLDVQGTTTIGTQNNVAARVGAGGTEDLLLGSLNGNAPFVASTTQLQLRTNGTQQLTVGATGGVGIGSGVGADGVVSLNVGGGTSAAALAGFSNWVAYFGLGNPSLNGGVAVGSGANGNNPFIAATQLEDGTDLPLDFYTGGATHARIAGNGNVGIGTLSPTLQLNVGGTTSGSALAGLTNMQTYVGNPTNTNIRAGVVLGSGLNGNSPTIAASQFDDGSAMTLSVYTGGSSRVRVEGNGRIGIGGAAGPDTLIGLFGPAVSTSATAYAYRHFVTVPATITSIFKAFESNLVTDDATFTLNNYLHYDVSQLTIGAGSAVTNQFGFFVSDNVVGATNNYGFYGAIPAGTNRWNLYMAGTAQNYLGNNLLIGGTSGRATTAGTNQLVLFNGTAPVGTLANGVSFYSATGEARVMDAAGNSTLLSPHDKETNEWIYDSVFTPTGKRLRIRMEAMMKAINEHFGWDFIEEFAV
jgi:hypothetical protein